MIKKKPKSETQKLKDKEAIEKRNKLFMEIWASRPHKCENCGISLGNEPKTYFFDHLLEKSKYPEYELLADNIMLVCMTDHDKKTRGFLSPTQDMKIKQLKKKLNIV